MLIVKRWLLLDCFADSFAFGLLVYLRLLPWCCACVCWFWAWLQWACLLVLVVNSVVYFNFFLLIYSVVVSLTVEFIVFVWFGFVVCWV